MESIPKMPSKLVIFKVECSRYWWTRVYFNGRYHVKSTKTEARKEAQGFAKELYNDALLNKLGPAKSKAKTKTFAGLAQSLLSVEKATAKASLYGNDKGKVDNFLTPFFGEKLISEIQYRDLAEMLEKLNEKNLSPATKKHYLSLTHKVFKHAVHEGVIHAIPQFPKLAERLKTKEKRDYLEMGEYRSLNNLIIKLESKGEKVRGIPITEELKHLNKFMVNSFLRPSDIKVLQHKHITRKTDRDANGKQFEWLVLSHPATKTTAQEVHTMPEAATVFDELVAFRKKDHKDKLADAKRRPTDKERKKALEELEGAPYLDPNDYVFFPTYKNRQTAIAVWSRLFRKVVEISKLKERKGKNLSLYSLRHTAIMYRLINSQVDSLVLAKNARTSQGVIEQFYGSHLTTSQARKQLHSFIERQPAKAPTKKKAVAKPKAKKSAAKASKRPRRS